MFYIRLFNAKNLPTPKKKQNVKNIPPQCFVSTCKIKWTKFIYKIRCSLRLNLYSISLILQYIFENLTVGLDIFYALNTHFKFCINWIYIMINYKFL